MVRKKRYLVIAWLQHLWYGMWHKRWYIESDNNMNCLLHNIAMALMMKKPQNKKENKKFNYWTGQKYNDLGLSVWFRFLYDFCLAIPVHLCCFSEKKMLPLKALSNMLKLAMIAEANGTFMKSCMKQACGCPCS